MDHLPQRSPEALLRLAATARKKGTSRPSNLREQVNPETMKLWPTPRASSAKGPSQKEINEKNPKYRLETEVMLWPTPSAQQAGDGDFIETLQTRDGKPAEPGQRAYNPKTGKHSQITLNRAVKMWPTPRARDFKDGESVPPSRVKNPELTTLGQAVRMGEEERGSLNPEWVEWLMGFPNGWTDLNL
jgi:hypothetical protein